MEPIQPNPRVVAIIQARMGSTRLPEKVLADIEGRPMLWHVVNRVRKARLVNGTVVATSKETADLGIVVFCERYEVGYSRGSETDVLDRFYQTAQAFPAKFYLRITADCPLIDPEVIDRVVEVL